MEINEPQEDEEITKEENTNDIRVIDLDGFKDFDIYLDLYNFNEEINQYGLDNKKEFFINGMKKTKSTLQTLLKVKPVKNHKFTDEQIRSCINNWDTSKIGSTSRGMADLGIDLFIFVEFKSNSDTGEYNLASAKTCFVDQTNGQPLLGVVKLNKDIDYSKSNSLQYFESIILHEFIHILGFSKYYLKNYKVQKNNPYGEQRTFIFSQKVLSLSKTYFNCNNIVGLELAGEFGSHWSERILLGNIMTEDIS